MYVIFGVGGLLFLFLLSNMLCTLVLPLGP